MYLGVARAIVAVALSATVIRGHAGASEPPPFVNETDADVLRRQADLHAQRRYAWRVIGTLTGNSNDQVAPAFESWHGEYEVFGPDNSDIEHARGIRGFSRTDFAGPSALAQSADSPVFTYTLYNDAAFNHIRNNHLYSRRELERLQTEGRQDAVVPGNRDVPQFPPEAVILKTAWWPVSQHGMTVLPVWDPDQNPPQAGIGYLSWRRVVGVDTEAASSGTATPVEFAGRTFGNAKRISIGSFYHVRLDKDLAERLMLDTTARKQAAVVLGRALQAGDYLILVGANLATRETRDWVWATLWWHDRPESGPYADDRPPALVSMWRNYLMQTAFDAITPEAVDGSPHICFSPWLEGRFPDGGHGGGTVSNCLVCHARASYPPVSFLPVTRGAPQLASDAAYLPGKLRTSFLWSIALHATP
jgi:hypothetical protein